MPRVLDTIILMTGAAEQSSLTSVLLEHNPQLTVYPAASLAELEALEPHYPRARLVSFVNAIVVPGRVLDALGFGAYNFNPRTTGLSRTGAVAFRALRPGCDVWRNGARHDRAGRCRPDHRR